MRHKVSEEDLMFGYITVDYAELKGKDIEKYRAFYCGLCQEIKARFGQNARFTLTYDMTFLFLLLSSLYQDEFPIEEKFCLLHPLKKRRCIQNPCSAYAADMNLLLVYYNLMDDWEDDKNLLHLGAASVFRKKVKKISRRYPRQKEAIAHYLMELRRIEKHRLAGTVPAVHEEASVRKRALAEAVIQQEAMEEAAVRQGAIKEAAVRQRAIEEADRMAALTGNLFREIYQMEEDSLWNKDLSDLGFGIGRFIYLADAFDDIENDRKKQTYNPFLSLYRETDFEELALGMMKDSAAYAAHAFERLPIVDHVDILRDILYSGIWTKTLSRLKSRRSPVDEKRRHPTIDREICSKGK